MLNYPDGSHVAEVTPAVTSVAVGTVSESQSVAWMWFPLSSIGKAAVCLPWADSAIRLVTLFPDTPRSALVSESVKTLFPHDFQHRIFPSVWPRFSTVEQAGVGKFSG